MIGIGTRPMMATIAVKTMFRSLKEKTRSEENTVCHMNPSEREGYWVRKYHLPAVTTQGATWIILKTFKPLLHLIRIIGEIR